MNKENIALYSYLIIDDDRFICDLISKFLHKHGVSRIEVADKGQAAINYLATAGKFPDIIMCDLNMPDMNGLELFRYLSREFFSGGIILISGSDKVILNAASKLGKAQSLKILGTLSKPFTPEALFEYINSYPLYNDAQSGSNQAI